MTRPLYLRGLRYLGVSARALIYNVFYGIDNHATISHKLISGKFCMTSDMDLLNFMRITYIYTATPFYSAPNTRKPHLNDLAELFVYFHAV